MPSASRAGIGAIRGSFAGWGRARAIAALAGAGAAVAALAPPLDRLGQEGLLTAHITQHVVLADVAAPLLLIGLPPRVAGGLGALLERVGRRPDVVGRVLTAAASPVGALVLWAGVTYFWFVPAVHRAAVPQGVVHTLDHAAFLAAGLLIWLIAFDPRPRRPLLDAARVGGLPWWARHVYAATTRVAMIPPAFAIWLAGPTAYYPDNRPLPFDLTRAGDQERAASVMIGFEMLLAGLAVILAFVFVSVHEGRERARVRAG